MPKISAQEQQRNQVRELMGTASQGDGATRKFTDSSVCKPYLLNCCVNEILEATRMSIGVCKRIHDVRLRTDFEKARASKNFGYELEVKNYLKSHLVDRDRWVETAKQKLAETQQKLTKPLSEQETVLEELKSKLEAKIEEAERLGEQGLVEDSLKVMEEVTELTNQKQKAELEFRNALPSLIYQQQKMRVCEVCSSILGAQDNDRRLADHFGGKLHSGYLFMKTKFDELEEIVSKQSAGSRTSVARSASSDEDSWSNERHGRRRTRLQERHQGHGRDNRRACRSPYRSSYRSRSRSRDNRRGSHSRHSNSEYRRYRR